MKEKSLYWPVVGVKGEELALLGRLILSFVRQITHAVETPGVFQLVFTPCCGEDLGFLVAEVVGQFLCYAFGREESAVGVEGDDHLFLWIWRRHVCGIYHL